MQSRDEVRDDSSTTSTLWELQVRDRHTRIWRFPGGAVLLLLLFLTLAAQAKPADKATSKPADKAAKTAPKPVPAANIPLGQGLTGADLKRIQVGLQAGLLKIFASDGVTVNFLKSGPGSAGIDGRELTALTPTQRDEVLSALPVEDPNALAESLLSTYGKVPRAQALALLGVLAHPGQKTECLDPELASRVLEQLRASLQPEENNVARRQAVLALAIQPETDECTVEAMIDYLERDHNAWNTFGVVQFFDLHREQIQTMAIRPEILEGLLASGSPHSDQILRDLGANPATADSSPSDVLVEETASEAGGGTGELPNEALTGTR